jgi:hypothetical protein
VIAGTNIINAAFMVVAAGFGIGMLKSGFSVPQVFLAAALLNAVVTGYIFVRVPEFPRRFVAWIARRPRPPTRRSD